MFAPKSKSNTAKNGNVSARPSFKVSSVNNIHNNVNSNIDDMYNKYNNNKYINIAADNSNGNNNNTAFKTPNKAPKRDDYLYPIPIIPNSYNPNMYSNKDNLTNNVTIVHDDNDNNMSVLRHSNGKILIQGMCVCMHPRFIL